MQTAKQFDYLSVLRALEEIPFGVGRKLLIEFLQGRESHPSIKKNRLHLKETFGSMAYEEQELHGLIDSLQQNGLVELATVQGNRFWKVLELSEKGRKELDEPSLYKKNEALQRYEETEITDKDRELFAAFGDFLDGYNEEQKKAIITPAESVLCIAGAGSGKTTVLTKRVEFLVKFRSVDARKILAITFTRKARQEMKHRLEKRGLHDAPVETFNSFCERMLRQHHDLVYDQEMRVVTYKDKMQMMVKALEAMKVSMEQAIDVYFTHAQKRSKDNEQLARIFMNDCFFIRDYFTFKGKEIAKEAFEGAGKHMQSAQLMAGLCRYIDAYMRKHGLRDFSDQVMDTLRLFREHPECVPSFEHVLIDEFQDVNKTQMELVDMLEAKGLFCVGDPRQSIYGWRGSDIQFILRFGEEHPGSEVITLKKNYRSSKEIVALINEAIRTMGVADLESATACESSIRLLPFDSEEAEYEFVMQAILNSDLAREEIFVLARTNRQLNELSDRMKIRGIKHVVRSDEVRKTVQASEGDVTLATVHGIKGLEADCVFVIGCGPLNFPCKASEHPVVEMVKVDEYDKDEEERRLFYVAMSRARKRLFLSYTGNRPTSFLSPDMLRMIDQSAGQGSLKEEYTSSSSVNETVAVVNALREWRKDLAREHDVSPSAILGEKALIELAQRMPVTMADLEGISGLGPQKVLRFGEEILKVVNGA